ncbi:PepSY-associated TM helix domain-containing protein [Acinetobacter rathckeae]|uniref:PepSY-associated TM helix domain-containing protein n=1 Tax=Acinetobacter rathckeae TaxID=2605272 RepID=UPI0018A2C1F1|nr:PepSY-associated TM helix domain-containing protein [Acinetobacter rathckeae]MBF7687127.1 PepSY domain-containing protein [Acinetobacter rathckeae]MBF7694521.1 PepSY domain-containing protein [Acinetobacter rathckeae]
MTQPSAKKSFIDISLKLVHSYMGFFIAPFIFIAALTGVLYGLTPQFENYLYQRHTQVTSTTGTAHLLSEQIGRAQKALPAGAHIMEVRPASTDHTTTRVLYMDQESPDEMTAIFINPYTLALQGRTQVYGKSGVFPVRTFLDHMHRDLLLGQYGRIYSELVASWLGLFAITGFWQWYQRKSQLKTTDPKLKKIRWHIWIGLCVLPMMLFFSVTGLTWSNWAGTNIAKIRHLFNGDTPSLNLRLDGTNTAVSASQQHAEHEQASNHRMAQFSGEELQYFDQIVQVARSNGLTASALRIIPSENVNVRAWSVQELQHAWPTKVDSLAVDMRHAQVIDQTRFADYPLSAKLTRWGIDLHVGVLFGWVNQLVLVLSGLLILVAIAWAYASWLSRLGFKAIFTGFHQHIAYWYRSGSWLQLASVIVLIVLSYWLIPVWTMSIIAMHVLALLIYACVVLGKKKTKA